MEIEVLVSLVDLKHAFRRLLARLPDESEAGGEFVVFNACRRTLEILAGGTSEILTATVVHPGRARAPCSVFRGVARILRFYRGRTVTVAFSEGVLRIARTDFRHPKISVLARGKRQEIVGTKPAKPQNL